MSDESPFEQEQLELVRRLESRWQLAPGAGGRGAAALLRRALLRLLAPLLAEQREFNAALVRLSYLERQRAARLNALMAQVVSAHDRINALAAEGGAAPARPIAWLPESPPPGPDPQESEMSTPDRAAPEEGPVDVAAIMRQIRRNIAERREREDDRELDRALAEANERWGGIHEPLRLPPPASLPGRAWDVFRTRLHHEVRGYLDAMIFRQTEFNSAVVRALNSLARREQPAGLGPEVEALRDEVIQLREELRRLREQVGADQAAGGDGHEAGAAERS